MNPVRLLDRVVGALRRSFESRSRDETDSGEGLGRWVPGLYFLALALLTFAPLLRPGYVLSLDMVFSPNMRYAEYLFRAKDPLYYGRLPIAIALDGLALVVPHWILQRLVLVTIVAGSGLAAFAACRDRSGVGALFAGTLYAINPFVYVRLLAGHWWFLLGYAVLPLAVVAFAASLSDRSRARRAAGWTTLACAFDPHVAVLAAIAFAGVGVAAVARSSRPGAILSNAGRVGTLTAAFNAYWLLPALRSLGSGASSVSGMNSLDLFAFSARGTIAGNVPLSVAMLFGFWRGGYDLPLDWFPGWILIALFAGVLLAAIDGWVGDRDDPLADGLAIAGGVGFLLGLGVSVDATAPVFRALYEHAVVFRGMRDTQKFVALLALAYALLGARGVDRFARAFDTRFGQDADGPSDVPIGLPSRVAVIRGLLVVAVVATPIAYAWPMVGGTGGQLSTTDYPDGWHEANDHVTDGQGDGRVVFLPWHGYLAVPWAGGTVANPADAFFERPVLRSRSLDHAGVGTRTEYPAQAAVRSVLDDPDAAAPIGAALAPVGAEYVVVAKVADYRRYDSLRSQPDLEVALENDDLIVYENAAYDRAPVPETWPRSGPPVPFGAISLGALVTLATLAWCQFSCRIFRDGN